jgi:TetR/AcrR family transcriptional repressor of bet genes
VAVNFSAAQFKPQTIAAWLAFYVEAQRSPALRRLLKVYARRLHSNLMSGLILILPRQAADTVAEATAALIDGLYIRRALKDGVPDAATAIALIEDYLNTKLSQTKKAS